MIRIKHKSDCCGCEACVQRCPKRCISLHRDQEGFLYPLVDESICINCGLCERVCPVINQGEPSQNIGKSFLKGYAAVCLEGAIIVLACIIFSVFAASPPVVDVDAAAASMVWSYIGELIFNMLILVGSIKMADRIVHEMMGL